MQNSFSSLLSQKWPGFVWLERWIARWLAGFFLGSFLLATAVSADEKKAPEKTKEVEEFLALQKKAEENDGPSQVALARAYFRGLGVEQNPQEGLRWLERAAALEEPEAWNNLGVLYLQGRTVEQDEAKARAYFQQAAEAGFGPAQVNLGVSLRQSKTLPRSHEESLQWLEKAAADNVHEAHIVLGQLYFLGDDLMLPDYDKAFPHLQVAAELGDVICQNMLGVSFRDGRGTPSDAEEATKWFRIAAEKNNAKAQSNLARMLGVELPESPTREEAIKWLIISKEQGEPTARRIFAELQGTFSAAQLAKAQSAANLFLLNQRARSSSAD